MVIEFQDLEMMMMSAVNMVNAAAEVAYMAGESPLYSKYWDR